jgi:hypothetical protein
MSDRLRSAMDRLAADGGKADTPPEMEAALLAEFYREKLRKKRTSWVFVAGTVAASLLAALAVQHRLTLKPGAASVPPIEEVRESEQPFIGLPYITPPAPYERIRVERMELPVTALIAVGLPMRGADPGARVEADVVVGQDGRARAVRLVENSRSN